jgi:hypothetical protein
MAESQKDKQQSPGVKGDTIYPTPSPLAVDGGDKGRYEENHYGIG